MMTGTPSSLTSIDMGSAAAGAYAVPNGMATGAPDELAALSSPANVVLLVARLAKLVTGVTAEKLDAPDALAKGLASGSLESLSAAGAFIFCGCGDEAGGKEVREGV